MRFSFCLTQTRVLGRVVMPVTVHFCRCDLPGGNHPGLPVPWHVPSCVRQLPRLPTLESLCSPLTQAPCTVQMEQSLNTLRPWRPCALWAPWWAMAVLEAVRLPANVGASRQECASGASRMDTKGRLLALSAWWFCGRDPVLPVCNAPDLCPGCQPLS